MTSRCWPCSMSPLPAGHVSVTCGEIWGVGREGGGRRSQVWFRISRSPPSPERPRHPKNKSESGKFWGVSRGQGSCWVMPAVRELERLARCSGGTQNDFGMNLDDFKPLEFPSSSQKIPAGLSGAKQICEPGSPKTTGVNPESTNRASLPKLIPNSAQSHGNREFLPLEVAPTELWEGPRVHSSIFWGGLFNPSSFHTLILEPKNLRPSAPGRDFRSVSPAG